MSQLCGRVMADENQERGGIIINIASTAGVQTSLENRAAYCASKAGMVGFARECAREYAQYGLRVHTLLPDEERPSSPQIIAETVRALCYQPGDELIHLTDSAE
jgi:NAD(P)-dependent dehydrogenase (short-subunit alcohol dehydrogenase family)